MSWPTLPSFGIVDNPLLNSPFVQSNENGTVTPPQPTNRFLLMSGGNLLLMNGQDMLLME